MGIQMTSSLIRLGSIQSDPIPSSSSLQDNRVINNMPMIIMAEPFFLMIFICYACIDTGNQSFVGKILNERYRSGSEYTLHLGIIDQNRNL